MIAQAKRISGRFLACLFLAALFPTALQAKAPVDTNTEWPEAMLTARKELAEELKASEENPDPKLTQDVWNSIAKVFPVQTGWVRGYLRNNSHLSWFESIEDVANEKELLKQALAKLGRDAERFQPDVDQLIEADPSPDDPRWLTLFERISRYKYRPAEIRQLEPTALRRAVEDLWASFPDKYRRGPEYLKRLDDFDRKLDELEMALARRDNDVASSVSKWIEGFRTLQEEALLANPLLDFDRLLFVRRKADRLGLPQNWQGNCATHKDGYDNQIMLLEPMRSNVRRNIKRNTRTLFQPENGAFVGDVDLHFDAKKMLFSMPGSNNRWQIWEIGADGKNLRQVTLGEEPDVDNYDACYLPNERIVFDSTRCFAGVPCVGGGNAVANLFLMEPDGSNVRQLCVDQDHDWCPTVLNNGRVLYSRWEYSDLPHYFSRLLFQMNPDGTGQMEYYASNSMWPNSIFYSRPIPNHPTKIVTIISGHHGVPRMGELIVFDPAIGRREADGAVQRIPGHGRKVEPIVRDGLVNGSWPKFLHPYPLSDKYFLVSSQPTSTSLWGIYLVDVFDNMTLLHEEPDYVAFEPLPLRKTIRPPVIPDRVDLAKDDATVYLTDVYRGPGLAGVPRGTVKKLRVYSPHYAYPGMGGHINIGIDGPWDARRILGTVPVNPDGSAAFRVPANTPLVVQPLDADGRAIQVMRSWFTAMPGETLSCVGCHESQNAGPPTDYRLASTRKPVDITPWLGPERPFGFTREVQPVLERYCIGCHDGGKSDRPNFTLDRPSPFRKFTPSYCDLHPFVRRPGPESDNRLQVPMEYHASSSELVQMLEKGHHDVQLDAESWDRLVTWIDLNVPDHSTWHEHRGQHCDTEARRLTMRTLYANRPEDPEAIPETEIRQVAYVKPTKMSKREVRVSCPNWPFDANEAKRRQAESGEPNRSIELADGITMELVLVPEGQFVMGSTDGAADEYPPTKVHIEKPFYIGQFEVTNRQYAQFDSTHDSSYMSYYNKDVGNRGFSVNNERQPAIRISWQQAMDFCRWLSKTTGRRFSLPTEAQWEYAARAGTNTPMSFGKIDADFGKDANLADLQLNNITRRDSPKWIPTIDQRNDGATVTADVGRFQPNAWGLHDVHGNASEWTLSSDRPYPYNPRDGRDRANSRDKKVVRGGSFHDRPHRATSSFRLSYQPWQRVYNVGFRVVMEP